MPENNVYKLKAKAVMAGAKPSLIWASLIVIAVSALLSYLYERIASAGFTTELAEKILYYYDSGDYEKVIDLFQQATPEGWVYLIEPVISFLTGLLGFGFIILVLNSIRKNGQAAYGNLLDSFGYFFKYLVMSLLKSIMIWGGMLLFIVPGILALYTYRMSEYIMADHPDYSAVRCLKESRLMMKGHKADLFRLDLSFWGWYLLLFLGSLSFGLSYIVQMWTMPYFGATYAMFYENLRDKAAFDSYPLYDVKAYLPPRE